MFKAKTAFPALLDKLQSLQIVDIVILSGGFVGAIVAGIVMIIFEKMDIGCFKRGLFRNLDNSFYNVQE